MQIFLETERLVLRRFTLADVDNLFDLDSDPEVMRFLTGGTSTPREVIQSTILPAFLHTYEHTPSFGVWAALEKKTLNFLGWFSFRQEEGTNPGNISIGYRLRRAAWGQGYATEGSRALIHKGFSELGVQSVSATTYQDNVASRRVMEKAGLKLVRTYHITLADLQVTDTLYLTSQEIWDGDDVEYMLLKADWEQQHESV